MSVGARGDAFLSRIISTVSSSLDLDEVLRAVVGLLSDASAVHACFVYLIDEPGDRLVLRAASAPFEHLAGEIVLERGEGLAWWAAEHREPAFIAEGLLTDPRVKVVPELEEERYQSLLCVPVFARDGSVIGVVSAHSEAPREFTQDEVDFLVTGAALVAGAIENARLYGATRARVAELEALTELAEAIAGADTLEQLLPAATDGARALLGASSCHLYLIDPGGDELVLRRSSPAQAGAPGKLGLAGLGPELRARRGRLSVPLVAESELVGLVVAEGTRSLELGRALAGQLAVGIRKVRLIERLTERNLIKDFLDDLAGGRPAGDLDGRAARLGCDLGEPHVVLAAEPVDDAAERALTTAFPGALVDRREQLLLGLVRVPRGGVSAIGEAAAAAIRDRGDAVAVGISSAARDAAAAYADAFLEARHALAGSSVVSRHPRVVAYEELGAYKYLLRIAEDAGMRDSTVDAVSRLAAYDAERQTQLLATLEEFLRRHGSISATSEALYVHPNTLRQRLRRIAEIADVDLRRDDWLMLEIAVKLARLRGALLTSDPDTRAR
jgi:GAF domain-containing protein